MQVLISVDSAISINSLFFSSFLCLIPSIHLPFLHCVYFSLCLILNALYSYPNRRLPAAVLVHPHNTFSLIPHRNSYPACYTFPLALKLHCCESTPRLSPLCLSRSRVSLVYARWEWGREKHPGCLEFFRSRKHSRIKTHIHAAHTETFERKGRLDKCQLQVELVLTAPRTDGLCAGVHNCGLLHLVDLNAVASSSLFHSCPYLGFQWFSLRIKDILLCVRVIN